MCACGGWFCIESKEIKMMEEEEKKKAMMIIIGKIVHADDANLGAAVDVLSENATITNTVMR